MNSEFYKKEFKPEIEEEILRFWEQEKVFEKSLEKTKDKQPFTFYDGPPFATGTPHYGSLLSSVIKDVVGRYQTMKGRFVRRRWGWDCHGLPIEEIVERELGISGKKQIEEIGIGKFNETCRSMVLQYVAEWKKMIRRIARWVDFDNSYKTMDREYMESVWWGFKEMYKKELVYEGRKVLLYCPRCETPVSNFEVAMDNSYKTVTEEAVTVKFKVKPRQKIGRWEVPDNTYLLAWTTTPWTLPGNVALAVGKDIDYVVMAEGNDICIVAKNLAGTLKDQKPFLEIKGKDLESLRYEPLFTIAAIAQSKQGENAYRVYIADFVTTEKGTGIVHTAVVYGEEDYELGLRENLPVEPLLDEKGHFNTKAPEFIYGEYFKKAEKAIMKDLENRGLIFARAPHAHSYPHCWRCSTALYYNAIPAWFVNVQKIKKELLQSNKKEINWFPAHLKLGRYAKSVEQAPDWNISRNRYWGNPIPVWKCDTCGENIVVGNLGELGADLKEIHRPYIDEVVLKCACGGNARRIKEIFDSWMEAGSMPFAEYHYPFENKEIFESRYPAQFVAEYIPQTRAWFYVMHVIGFTLFGKAPFENVVTTGTILAEDGAKMSKSKRNYPDPWEVIERYGVDSLRLYLMNSPVMLAEDLNFNVKELEGIHRKVTLILSNVRNYFVTYAREASWKKESLSADTNVLDEWIEARTKGLVNGVTDHLDEYDTVRATRLIEEYIADLSTWYVRRSRGRKDAAFFGTLFDALHMTSKIMAPLMPYLAEYLYQSLREFAPKEIHEESVHLATWPKKEKVGKSDKDLLSNMVVVRDLASKALAVRKAENIPVRQPLAILRINAKALAGEDELLQVLAEEVNVKRIEIDGKFKDEVALDITLTEELKLEGLVRGLERIVQELRKKQNLKVGELAALHYSTEDAELKRALELINKKKTNLSQILETKKELETFELEGKKVSLGIVK
ncbi:MAG: isoleucine--tRNA ligase [Candidatus Liptonbacteria bacterium]|nr:isoleucine--tRNA ligase [Candidatus Liptonbacteria bacterium]